MSRYIDAEKLERFFKRDEWGTPDERWRPESEFGRFVDTVPTEDVAPVVHARWIVQKKPVYISSAEYPLCKPTKLYITDFYNCSRCGRREPYQESYCHCGAKMDEEKKDG